MSSKKTSVRPWVRERRCRAGQRRSDARDKTTRSLEIERSAACVVLFGTVTCDGSYAQNTQIHMQVMEISSSTGRRVTLVTDHLPITSNFVIFVRLDTTAEYPAVKQSPISIPRHAVSQSWATDYGLRHLAMPPVKRPLEDIRLDGLLKKV